MVVQYSGLVSFIELNVLFQYGAFLFSAIYYFFLFDDYELEPKNYISAHIFGNHCFRKCV